MKNNLITLSLAFILSSPLLASSHREAPSIARDNEADLTDIYAFKSPERGAEGYYTFVMNVAPAGQAYAAPNWYQFGDDVLYELHIDNNGDAVEDVTYQFRFKTDDYRNKEGAIIANFPQITFENGRFSGSLSQSYSITKVIGGRRSGNSTKIADGIPVAPPRIGPYTTDGGVDRDDAGNPVIPSVERQYQAYKNLSENAVRSIGGNKFFAGPRNDPFFVDLGAVFDRVGVRVGAGVDSLAKANVLSIVFEIKLSEILSSEQKHFGVWATTSRPQGKVLRTGGKAAKYGGGWVQVSRLGNPLVNEVVIKMRDKDKFNATEPKDDAANYASHVVAPQLGAVLRALYGKADAAANIPAGSTLPLLETFNIEGRSDLVAAFVTGIPGVNAIPNASGSGDMLRVNVDLPDSISGWPTSGRRLTDDVVKSALTFLTECRFLADQGNFDLQNLLVPGTQDKLLPNHTKAADTINCALDDFVAEDSNTAGNPNTTGYGTTNFPYLDLPHSAYNSGT